MSFKREPTYRYLRYSFAWRGIKVSYLLVVALAGGIFDLWFVFPPWVIARAWEWVGEPLGAVGNLFCVTLRPPWWAAVVAVASGVAAICVYQWRRDPELLSRKISSWAQPRRLSPLLVDRRDAPLRLRLKALR